jgi:hypothetical protein
MWAFGMTFPCRDEETLVRTVIGRRGLTQMPPRPSLLFVASIYVMSAALARHLGFSQESAPGKPLSALAGLLAGALYFIRGLIGLLPAFEQAQPMQPFLSLNRMVYSPLAFFVGGGFVALTVALPNWTWRLSGFAN